MIDIPLPTRFSFVHIVILALGYEPLGSADLAPEVSTRISYYLMNEDPSYATAPRSAGPNFERIYYARL